jgi:Tfp pilus assembly protein PilF
MDLTALVAAVFIALGVLGTDAVINADNLVVEVVAPPRSDKISIDDATLEQTFVNQLHAIAATRSLVDPPEIRAGSKQGLGMALAQATHVENVARALQTELGYEPDRLRLALFVQNGAVRALLSGAGRGHGAFEEVLAPHDDEALPDFVRRAALRGVSELAPYTTVLYLLQMHSGDKNFADVLTLAQQAEAELPPTPVNSQRALYQNVRGIVQLFQNDSKGAETAFAAAVASDPGNPVAALNLAFAEIELNEYGSAAQRMERMIHDMPTTNAVLLATAYMTWAAAEMGLRDPARADALLATALQLYPTSSTGYDLWADAKDLRGDHVAAEAMRRKALEVTADTFENYAEVAALYFHLSWLDNEPVTRSKFASTPTVTLH